MKLDTITPNTLICPLCGQLNSCVNLGTRDVMRSCWCNDPSIVFPKALLAKIPPEKRGKSCICKACVLKFQGEKLDGPEGEGDES